MTRTGGIIIARGGLAAARTAEQLRRSGYTRPITIVSDEDHLPYDRPPLSKDVLRSETDDVTTTSCTWSPTTAASSWRTTNVTAW